MHVHAILLTTATCLLAGCPDTSTAEIDPSLLGGWVDHQPDSESFGSVLSFEADGSVVETALDGFTNNGIYVADGTKLEIDDELDSISTNYLVEGDRLFLPALLRTGVGTGPVGTWHGETVANGVTFDLNLTTHADNTFSFAVQRDGETGSLDGRWSLEEQVLLVDVGDDELRFHVGEAAIGFSLFDRQERDGETSATKCASRSPVSCRSPYR